MEKNFESSLKAFFDGCQAVIATERPEHSLDMEIGNRYIKLVIADRMGHRSVYAFIDQTTGNVLKPASWKAPAKHARSNILNPDHGLSGVNPWGCNYIR